MPQRLVRQPAFALGAAIAVVSGACSLWVVFEQDIYWQVRAGDELWRTRMFPQVDTWSYSARGQPWMNIQWLSTLILRGVYALGAEAALVWGRAVLVVLLMSLLTAVLVRAARTRLGVQLGVVAMALPGLYVALWPRLQLRSDTLVMAVFAGLSALWAAPLSDGAGSWQRRTLWTLAAVCLAANLHAGTAPFVAVAAGTYVLSSRMDRRVWPWLLAVGAMFFCTPYGPRVLPLLWDHVFYYEHNILQNSDQQPLSVAYFAAQSNAWAGQAWLMLIAVTGLAWAVAGWRRIKEGPWTWTWSWLPQGLCLLLFTALSINRVRAIPYQIIFMLPLLARGIAAALAPRQSEVGRVEAPVWPLWAGACINLNMAAGCVWGLHALWGFGVHEHLFPVGSTRFVEHNQPQRNILHTFACGAYMVWHLRDYPLYVDTRETMFWPLQSEVLGAYHSAEITQAMIRKYDVHTVLMPIPQTLYMPGVGFEDVIASYLPSQDWALVYFDKITFVMVRRMPAHEALIKAHEYTLLRPNLPANVYPLSTGRTPEKDRVFEQELRRCLADEPESVYCLVAQAAWWRVHAPEAHREEAVALLERARSQDERWGSLQHFTLMVELESAYKAAGRLAEAEALQRLLAGGEIIRMPARAP